MKRIRNQRGLSLIEVTIMLLVLMLLTSVLAPSIFDFVKDAQWVKVKEDCEAIAISMARLTRDVGCVVQWAGTLSNQAANCKYLPISGNQIPSVLYSDGKVPTHAELAATAIDTTFPYSSNWSDASFPAYSDSLQNQLVTNGPPAPDYVLPPYGPASPWGPWFNKGWRGAYLGAPIGPDPWGTAYLVNTLYLNTPTGGKGHNYDTFCISAGPNMQFETPMQQIGAKPVGDDYITVISGGLF